MSCLTCHVHILHIQSCVGGTLFRRFLDYSDIIGRGQQQALECCLLLAPLIINNLFSPFVFAFLHHLQSFKFKGLIPYTGCAAKCKSNVDALLLSPNAPA